MVVRRVLACAVVSIGLLAGVIAVPPAGAEDPPGPAVVPYKGGTIEVAGGCRRVGTPSTVLAAHYSNMVYDHDRPADRLGRKNFPASPDEITCAQQIWVIMERQLAGEFGSTNVAVKLQQQLLTGRAHLERPYEVFLDNIDIDMLMLVNLAADEQATCDFTGFYLMLSCIDVGNGAVQVPQLGVSIPSGGVYSEGGGTTWGNVLLVNGWGNQSEIYDELRMHHEQVHAQQWARGGSSFWQLYFEDYLNVVGKAQQAGQPGAPSWYSKDPFCNSAYERAANFGDGGYSNCVTAATP